MNIKQKATAPILMTALVLAMSFSVCNAQESTAVALEGSGTSEDPYQISTAEEFYEIRNDLTASYILTEDIDLSGYENWEPIGNMTYGDVNMETGEMDMTKVFSGSLDGDGHSISQATCSTDQNMLAVGIFGCFTGTLEDVTVENVLVAGDETTMASGGVVGYAIAGSITNVTLSGENSVTGINCVGGIAGGSMAQVENCMVESVDIVVIGDNDFSDGRIIQHDVAECGGLVVGGSFAGTVDYCTANGTVTATGNEAVGLGGIAGCIQCTPEIKGNTVTVEINAGNGHAIGGLCGYAGMGDDGDGTVDEPCAITDCSAEITIVADGATHVGGLVGTGMYYYGMEDRFSIENCSVSGTIDGAVTPGTVAGRAEGSEIISCETDVLVDGVAQNEQVGTTDRMYESADQY